MNALIARKKRRKCKTIDMKWEIKKRLTHLFRCLAISSLPLLLGSNLQTSVLEARLQCVRKEKWFWFEVHFILLASKMQSWLFATNIFRK